MVLLLTYMHKPWRHLLIMQARKCQLRINPSEIRTSHGKMKNPSSRQASLELQQFSSCSVCWLQRRGRVALLVKCRVNRQRNIGKIPTKLRRAHFSVEIICCEMNIDLIQYSCNALRVYLRTKDGRNQKTKHYIRWRSVLADYIRSIVIINKNTFVKSSKQ